MDEKIQEIISEYKKITEKDCYSIEYCNEKPGILDDKIGGIPYLPVGVDYPKDKYGNPMSLFIQINLKKLNLREYPSGIFELFITTNEEDIFCSDYLSKDSYEIRFFEENLEYQKSLPEIELKQFLSKGPLKLNLKKEKMYMPVTLGDDKAANLLFHLFEEKFKVKIRYPIDIETLFNISYFDLMDNINEENEIYSNIGGYPIFTNDPDIDYYEKQECLVFLETDLDLDKGICFGADAGNFYILLTEEDIKNKNFDEATCNFEF